MFAGAAVLAVTAVSCSDKEKVYSPEDQKAYIEDAFVEAIENLDVDDWKNTVDFAIASYEVFNGITPDESVKTYLDKVEDGFDKGNGITEFDYSKLKGEFSVEDNVLSRKDSKGLSLSWKLNDENSTPCLAKGEIKNSSTKIRTYSSEDDMLYPKAEISGSTVYKDYLIVPSSIKADVTAAGSKIAGIKVSPELKLSGEKPSILDSYSLATAVTAGEYTLDLSKLYLKEMKSAGIKWALKRGSKSILSFNFGADGDLLPVVAAAAEPFSKASVTEPRPVPVPVAAVMSAFRQLMQSDVNGNIDITVMGRVSLKGKIDIEKFNAVMEKYSSEADSAYELPEASLKALLKELEKTFDVNISFKGTRQATLGLEAVPQTDPEAVGSLMIIPVIRFADGSAYQIPQEFFQLADFSRAIEAASAFGEKFMGVFGPYIESAKEIIISGEE